MSELQAEQAPLDNDNIEANVTPEPQLSSVESESAPEKVTFSDEQQALVNDIVAGKVAKTREAERESDRIRKERDDALARIPKEVKPHIPEMPDEFADNRDQLIFQRDEAIRQSTIFDHNQTLQLQQQQAASLKVEQDRQIELSQVFTNYEAQSKKLGVDAQEQLAADNAVGQYGLSREIILHIAKEDHGPLITSYLHKNPAALETLRQLDNLSAAAYIETQIKPNAAALGNKQPTAPDPVETLNGSGVAPQKRGPKGATYE